MFDSKKAFIALQQKQSLFEEYRQNNQRQRRLSGQQLAAFDKVSQKALDEMLASGDIAWPGALPTAELDKAEKLCLPFEPVWANHQEARYWAKRTLMNRPVLAVDGSQITPDADLATPVGAVQIGWFINAHNEQGDYIKDLDFEVFLPQDLVDKNNGSQELDFANRRVNQERFVRECEKFCELMAQYKDAPDEQKPLCFFDGSFIVSFAGQLKPELAAPYLGAVTKLLDCSKRYRVPIVGFVDGPHSRDIAKLIEVTLTLSGYRMDGSEVSGQSAETRSDTGPVASEQEAASIYPAISSHDAELLAPRLPSNQWGVRSPLFVCAREDALSKTDVQKGEERAAFYKTVAFTYLRLNQNRNPARIELPTWIVDEGRAEEIINLVRAECIVGVGYPYAIETADALAVISYRDRQRFYSLVQQSYPGFNLTQARKMASKQARR